MLNELEYILSESIEIVKMQLKVVVDLFIIHFPIDMNQQISQPGHFSQGRSKICRNNLMLGQNRENVAVVFGGAIAFAGNYMRASINARCNGDLQIVFGRADFSGLFKNEARLVLASRRR